MYNNTFNKRFSNRYYLILDLLLIVGIILFYCFSVIRINGNLFSVSSVPYYNYLTDSFVHLKTYIQKPPTSYDLSLYNNRLYLYWGFSPVAFVLPFYLFKGVVASDVFYTLVAGIANIILFYLIIQKTINLFKLKPPWISKSILLASFALVSPNYYLSLGGRIWHTNQVISVFYLLICLLFFVNYISSNFKPFFIIISILFFNLAWIARNTLFVYVFIFFYPIVYFYKLKKYFEVYKTILIIVGLIFLGTIVFFTYNQLRFSNMMETGITYQMSDPRFADSLREKKLFSLNYFPNNFYHYFINSFKFDLNNNNLLIIDPEGNSIFMVYPFVIFCLMVLNKKYFIEVKQGIFIGLFVFTAFMITSSLLLFVGSGWTQFGSRYFFDAIPALFIVCLFTLTNIPKLLPIIMGLYGILINYYGAVFFFSHY